MLIYAYISFISLFIFNIGDCYIEDGNSADLIVIEGPFPYNKRFKPDWDDLDKRTPPEWYDKAKIGIFLHWGVFSVPGFVSEWFWNYWEDKNEDVVNFMKKNYPPGFSYQEFAPMFKAEFFDPQKFAELFAKSGARYVVLTSKHHEGFTLFPSKRSYSWNSVDVGPHRDLVGELAEAVRNKSLKFGVYHSLYEWYNPIYLEDKKNNFTTQDYPLTKLWPDLKQLVNDYKPSILWADGDWEAQDSYWKSKEFLAWLYNDSPVKNEILVNDRWGMGTYGKHGDFYNYQDRYNPGKLLKHKWENAFTLDHHSWGFRRNMDIKDVMTISDLLLQVISTVSCGGNALINIGPTKEGTIAPIFEERLLQLGEWLSTNGEAIYESSPWVVQNDTLNGNVWYTCTKDESDRLQALYAMFVKWPKNNHNYISLANTTSLLQKGHWEVEMLGNQDKLYWKIGPNKNTMVYLPHVETVNSKYGWTLKFTKKDGF